MNALKMEKTARLQKFAEFRKRAICSNNKILLPSTGSPGLVCERKMTTSDIVMCKRCQGFYAKKSFYQTRCLGVSSLNPQSEFPTRGSLPGALLGSCVDDEDFTSNILAKFYNDVVGRLCKFDPMVKKIGKTLWQQQKRSLANRLK